ncbi:MAG TPA: carbohydrate ABC transporter permease, partial [Spirochaetia bacterium]|nr:carbohydrate ABC transporter permease [Spirochaetia bacterium]
AKIDGANEWQIFSRVIIPMSLPAIATVGIFSFVNTWNDYMWQLVIVKDLIMSTLPVGIAKVSRTEMDIDYGLLMAGATFSAMPMLLLFVFFQKYFVKGITMGAIKG